MRLLSVVLTLFLATHSSFAIIGETLEQCNARYGTPKEQDATSAAYVKDGVTIVVSFDNKKAAVIFYSKNDPQGAKVSFKEAEVMAILKTNGGDQAWILVDRPMPEDGWRTADKKLYAEHGFSGILSVTNRDHAPPSLRK